MVELVNEGSMTDEPTSLSDRAAAALRDYQRGQRERMADLVELVSPMLWHTARACGLDHQAAEDVVQLAWVRLLENVDRIEDPQAVVAWLRTVARREAWRVSRLATRVRPEDPQDRWEEPAETTVLATQPVVDPAAAALLSADSAVLWEHVCQLTPRCQTLLRIICFSDAPSYAEIAADLGMPVGSIGPTRGRCLARLRTALSHDPRWSL